MFHVKLWPASPEGSARTSGSASPVGSAWPRGRPSGATRSRPPAYPPWPVEPLASIGELPQRLAPAPDATASPRLSPRPHARAWAWLPRACGGRRRGPRRAPWAPGPLSGRTGPPRAGRGAAPHGAPVWALLSALPDSRSAGHDAPPPPCCSRRQAPACPQPRGPERFVSRPPPSQIGPLRGRRAHAHRWGPVAAPRRAGAQVPRPPGAGRHPQRRPGAPRDEHP